MDERVIGSTENLVGAKKKAAPNGTAF